MSAWLQSLLLLCVLACSYAFRVDDAHKEDSCHRVVLLGRLAAESEVEEALRIDSYQQRPRFPAVMEHQFSHATALTLTIIGVVAFCMAGAFLSVSMRNVPSMQQVGHNEKVDIKKRSEPRSPFGEPRRDHAPDSGVCHDVFLVRLKFLTVSLVLNLLPVTLGIVVYKLSNSLAVELDAVSALTDVFSLLVNITVEWSKRRTTARRVLCLDMTGAAISLTLLVAVGGYGVLQAIHRCSQPTANDSHVDHLGYMCCYNLLAVLCDGLTLVVWFWLRRGMLVAGDASIPQDQLNTFSSLMHSCVNMVQDVSVTSTILCLWYVSTRSGESRISQRVDTVAGDAFGSVLVCVCVLISAAFMLRESIPVVQKFCHLQTAEDAECEPRSPSVTSHDEPESEAAPEKSVEGNGQL